MPITVPCVKCKSRFQVPSKLAGTTVRCKQCGCAIRLPSPEKIQAKKRAAAAGTGKRGTKVKPSTAPSPAASSQKSAKGTFEESFELMEMDFHEPAKGGGAASPGPAAEPTVLSCSHCEGLLYYDPNFANQTVACPHCGNHLIMPEL